ncbi:MAG: 1-acyl-sn-glycerol-3-phosphate acyltransferase [Ruminococcaceae bacterium]|nr:1-acyl-sn-glycerol-3-phosphate acyltransferase [Oscillospiraceae bacterium]
MSNKPRLYSFFRWILSPIFKLVFRVEFINPHNLPKEGPYIIASNHISGIDPIIIAIGQKYRQIHFMAKAELFKNKFLEWLFLSIGCFPVDRGKKDIGAVRHFEKVVEDGEVMGIFIEGTRSKTGEFLKPKNGASLIAFDTKSPVVPVCLTKTKKGIICHFGEPLSLEELGFEKGGAREYREASRIIMDKIKLFREQDLS